MTVSTHLRQRAWSEIGSSLFDSLCLGCVYASRFS